jgi:hypothetical protein
LGLCGSRNKEEILGKWDSSGFVVVVDVYCAGYFVTLDAELSWLGGDVTCGGDVRLKVLRARSSLEDGGKRWVELPKLSHG